MILTRDEWKQLNDFEKEAIKVLSIKYNIKLIIRMEVKQ